MEVMANPSPRFPPQNARAPWRGSVFGSDQRPNGHLSLGNEKSPAKPGGDKLGKDNWSTQAYPSTAPPVLGSDDMEVDTIGVQARQSPEVNSRLARIRLRQHEKSSDVANSRLGSTPQQTGSSDIPTVAIDPEINFVCQPSTACSRSAWGSKLAPTPNNLGRYAMRHSGGHNTLGRKCANGQPTRKLQDPSKIGVNKSSTFLARV